MCFSMIDVNHKLLNVMNGCLMCDGRVDLIVIVSDVFFTFTGNQIGVEGETALSRALTDSNCKLTQLDLVGEHKSKKIIMSNYDMCCS